MGSAISANPTKQNTGCYKGGGTATSMINNDVGRVTNAPLVGQIQSEAKIGASGNAQLGTIMRGDGDLHPIINGTQLVPSSSGLQQNLNYLWVDGAGNQQVIPTSGVSSEIFAGSGDETAFYGRTHVSDYHYKLAASDVTKTVAKPTQ